MGEIKIYDHALSDAQITRNFQDSGSGASNRARIAAQETNYGEFWTCTVIPSDSFADGLTFSNTIEVEPPWLNGIPIVENLTLLPSSPLTTDDLEGDYDYWDPDDGCSPNCRRR